ncbi:MAG TPA: hypothetical protein VMF53_08980 [Alphaproteobacteria bacterium]|nr:hypothetical protein [Alphaproteobacteria bacterium]
MNHTENKDKDKQTRLHRILTATAAMYGLLGAIVAALSGQLGALILIGIAVLVAVGLFARDEIWTPKSLQLRNPRPYTDLAKESSGRLRTNLLIVIMLIALGVWIHSWLTAPGPSRFAAAPTYSGNAQSQANNGQQPRPLSRSQVNIPMNGNGPGATGGTLDVISGSGDFSGISSTNKTVNTSPSKVLRGSVTLRALNLGPSFAVAPLIYTPSWGDPSRSWRLINNWIPSGQSDQIANLSLVAPEIPGVYHVIFAFEWEIGGDHVASGTNYPLGADRWNDGHDIASLSSDKILQAQETGYTSMDWLYGSGYSHQFVPVDAITLVVNSS